MVNQPQERLKAPERLEEIKKRWANIPLMDCGTSDAGNKCEAYLYERRFPNKLVATMNDLYDMPRLNALAQSKADIDYLLSLLHQPASERCGECGHPGSQHETYADHDECLGCRGLDEPCCHFVAATGTGEEAGREPTLTIPAQWIIDHHHRSNDLDYACGECCRDRDDSTVVDGFVCVYHRALKAVRTATPPAPLAAGEEQPDLIDRIMDADPALKEAFEVLQPKSYREHQRRSAPTTAPAAEASRDEIDSPLLAGLGNALSTITSPMHDKEQMPDVEAVWAEFWKLNAILTSTTTTSDSAREAARQIVGTVFENTAASNETLEAKMIDRIIDYLTLRVPNAGEVERLRSRVLELETEIDTKAGYL
jgi:hypothetical protein